MKLTYNFEINAPVGKAFEFVNDSDKLKLWMKGLEKIEVISENDSDNPVGTKFRQHIRKGGKILHYDGEILEYNYPNLLGVMIESDMFSIHTTYNFESVEKVTKVFYESDINFKKRAAGFIGKMLVWSVKRTLVKQMKVLKKAAEE